MSKHVKQIVCGGCDLYCGLLAHVDVEKNQVVKIAPNPPLCAVRSPSPFTQDAQLPPRLAQ